jgi:DNA polymerase-3 subunit gamma/tau
MSQALYNKWRPHLWDEVYGQEHITTTLRNAIVSDRFAHAYLFAGPRGTGKTTTARLLAKAVNCLAPSLKDRPCNQCDNCKAVNDSRFLDLIEIDAASNTSVEDVRDLRDKINFAPNQGKYKVYIIDEVHMLSTAAFNALLKTLEEPPSHAIFILATTEIHKIPATVLSRCQRHQFRRIPVSEITRQLQTIVDGEHYQVDDEVLNLIARQSTGSMRDAISLLDQLASVDEKLTLASAQAVLGTTTSQAVIALVDAILDNLPGQGLDLIHQALDGGSDPRQFARQMVEYLRNILLIRMGNADQVDTPADIRLKMAEQAHRFSQAHLMDCLRTFNDAATDLRSSWQPALLLELALAETVQPRSAGQPVPPAATEPATMVSRPAAAVQPPAQINKEPVPSLAASVQTVRPPVTPVIVPAPAVQAAAASPVVEETPAEASAPSTGSADINVILHKWKDIGQLIRQQDKSLHALINSCKPLGIKQGVLILGFSSEVIRSKMDMNHHLEMTRSAVASVTGFDLPINCIVTDVKSQGLPSNFKINQNGLIGTALRDMGGEVIQIQKISPPGTEDGKKISE